MLEEELRFREELLQYPMKIIESRIKPLVREYVAEEIELLVEQRVELRESEARR